MQNLEKLYWLVNSMTRNEKRYFTQHTNLYSSTKKPDYLVLFDLISKHKDSNLEELKESVKQQNLEYLSLKMKYLYTTILKVLTNYKKSTNKLIKLHDQFQQVLILEGKGLLEDALVLLQKIKKVAEETENYPFLYQTTQKEMEVLTLLSHGRPSPELFEHSLNRIKMFDIIQNMNNYQRLSHKIEIIINGAESEEDLQEKATQFQENQVLLSDPKQALSKMALAKYYHLYSVIYYLKKEYEKMFISTEKAINLIEIEIFSPTFIFNLFQNYFVAYIHSPQRNIQEFPKYLTQLAQLEFGEEQYAAIQNTLLIGFQIEYFLRFKQPSVQEVENLLKAFENFYKKYYQYLYWIRKKLLFFDIIDFCIAFKKHDIAQDWLNHLCVLPKIKDLSNMEKLTLKFLQTILYYEQQVPSLFEREVRGINYFISKNKIEHPFALNVQQLFQELVKRKKDNLLVLKKHQAILKPLNTRFSDSLWQFNFVLKWLNHKVT